MEDFRINYSCDLALLPAVQRQSWIERIGASFSLVNDGIEDPEQMVSDVHLGIPNR